MAKAQAATGWTAWMEQDRLRPWIVASVLAHALVGLLLLIEMPGREIPEPMETAVPVEIVTPDMPQLAQAPEPLPLPAPPAPDAPAVPSPNPAPPTPPRPEPPTPLPPPPPPNPAAAPMPAPPTPTPPTVTPPLPTPPAPTPAPPAPTPPRPAPPTPPQQQAQATPAPPAPPLPLPPPPAPPVPEGVQQAQPSPPTPPRPTPPTPTPTPPSPPTPPRPTPTPPQQQAAASPPAPPAPPRPNPVPNQPPVPPARDSNGRPGTGQTPPVRDPAENSNSVQSTLERLRAAQAQNQAPTSRVNPAAGAPARGGGAPTGTATLTQGEIRGLAEKISECWSVDAGAQGLENITVELKVETDATGTIRVVRPVGSVPSSPVARAVYEAARRALLDPRCAATGLSREKLAAVSASTFRFSPRGLSR
ncbi:hypothetical protein [Roseomonas sp. WA12]